MRALAGPPGERPMSGGETHELPLPRGNSPIARKCTWLSGKGASRSDKEPGHGLATAGRVPGNDTGSPN